MVSVFSKLVCMWKTRAGNTMQFHVRRLWKSVRALFILAHLSRRLVGELIENPWSGVRPSSSTISNINISATRGPITMKFYQKHHWDGGKAAPIWTRLDQNSGFNGNR